LMLLLLLGDLAPVRARANRRASPGHHQHVGDVYPLPAGGKLAGAARSRDEGRLGMADTSETHVPQDMGSGVSGEPGIAYDPDRLGEPGDPGVPKGDQYPTNERDNITEDGYGGVGIDDVPGTRTPGEPVSSEPESTRADRDAGSLGELAKDASTSEIAAAMKVATPDDPYSHGDADQQQAEKHSPG